MSAILMFSWQYQQHSYGEGVRVGVGGGGGGGGGTCTACRVKINLHMTAKVCDLQVGCQLIMTPEKKLCPPPYRGYSEKS